MRNKTVLSLCSGEFCQGPSSVEEQKQTHVDTCMNQVVCSAKKELEIFLMDHPALRFKRMSVCMCVYVFVCMVTHRMKFLKY